MPKHVVVLTKFLDPVWGEVQISCHRSLPTGGSGNELFRWCRTLGRGLLEELV